MAKKIGRPKKSSRDLIAVCARAGRIKARQKEEAELLARPLVKRFVDCVKYELESFHSRCVPSHPVCLDRNGRPFTWNDDLTNFLVAAKDVATRFRDDPRWDAEWQKEFQSFLDRLLRADTYIDPLGGLSLEAAWNAFADEADVLLDVEAFRLTDYWCSKKSDGSLLFPVRSEMSFLDTTGAVLDAANEVLELSNLPTR